LGFEFVGVLCCELCGSMVDCRNPKVFAKKLDLGLDKSVNLVYNTIMKNNSTTTKENKMTTKQLWKSTIGNLRSYQGSIVHVISINEFWNEAKVSYTRPVGKQQAGIFTVKMIRLKKLGKTSK